MKGIKNRELRIRNKKTLIAIILILILSSSMLFSRSSPTIKSNNKKATFWKFQSVDTMKYSRDLARQKLSDPHFDLVIDQQVKNISSTGATHVAIGTPYDDEFLPFLRKWINAARKYKLKVWFRGNFSGWERWFGYSRIDRKTHTEYVKKFVLENENLFEDGDVFTSCPECENGGPGDPRNTRDTEGHRQFIIQEYKETQEAFRKIGKGVQSNFFSMNADVATLTMDSETTNAVSGIVVIDHYVASPQKLAADIKNIAKKTGGKVILGEFGAPIPDIHGRMSEDEQARWIENALFEIIKLPELSGINYWTNTGGSTEIWNAYGEPKKAVFVIKKIYEPLITRGLITDEIGQPIKKAKVEGRERYVITDSSGKFILPYADLTQKLKISSEEHKTQLVDVSQVNERSQITLLRKHEDIIFKVRKLLKFLFQWG